MAIGLLRRAARATGAGRRCMDDCADAHGAKHSETTIANRDAPRVPKPDVNLQACVYRDNQAPRRGRQVAPSARVIIADLDSAHPAMVCRRHEKWWRCPN
jgi:hypothetical protein